MLSQYKATLTKTHKPRTVIFLVKGTRVLLGYKKTGFGKGNYVGIGGKVENGETIGEGAVRELKEEIGVDVSLADLKKVAVLKFYFPHVKDERWNQKVCAYIVDNWEGNPKETEEIKPVWFDKNNLPFEQMWDDAKYWVPKILDGEKVFEEFLFDKDLEVVEYKKFDP